MVQIITVRREFDGKLFTLGDVSQFGIIDGFNQFSDDFRVHVVVDEDSNDPQYFSINEL